MGFAPPLNHSGRTGWACPLPSRSERLNVVVVARLACAEAAHLAALVLHFLPNGHDLLAGCLDEDFARKHLSCVMLSLHATALHNAHRVLQVLQIPLDSAQAGQQLQAQSLRKVTLAIEHLPLSVHLLQHPDQVLHLLVHCARACRRRRREACLVLASDIAESFPIRTTCTICPARLAIVVR